MPASNILYRYKLHHLLFWIAIFGGWYYFRYQDFSTTNKALLVVFIKVADLAVMVYVTNYILIPRILYKKRYLLFIGIFFLMIICSSMFKINLIAHILNPAAAIQLFNGDFKGRVYDNLIPHFLLVSTGAAFKLLLDYARAQKRLGDMAKEKAESELNFLKSQMNPHFLFNSLNSVYFLIDKKNTDARNALHKFSEMLRYQLYEVKDEKIPIEKEISYIQDYIDLQKLRSEDNCQVEFTITPEVSGFMIEPLLLVPFVENSFKHLSHFSNGNPNLVRIGLSKANGEMKFEIRNTFEAKPANVIAQPGGIGLVNVKRRLELLYPHQHQLSVIEKEGWFDVSLKMKIQN